MTRPVLAPPPATSTPDGAARRIADRIAAVDDFVAAGYEVHVNHSPSSSRDGWLADWAQLPDDLAARTRDAFEAQAAAEVILLTRGERLHEADLGWHPKAELLWTPEAQEAKWSQTGGRNVRYRTGFEGERVRGLTDLIAARTRGCASGTPSSLRPAPACRS